MKKLLFILTLLIVLTGYYACTGPTTKANQEKPKDRMEEGKELFSSTCTLCHGVDGTLGLNGAKNLATSTLSKAEKINIITHGKNAMAAYGNELSPEEIEILADYIETLKQK